MRVRVGVNLEDGHLPTQSSIDHRAIRSRLNAANKKHDARSTVRIFLPHESRNPTTRLNILDRSCYWSTEFTAFVDRCERKTVNVVTVANERQFGINLEKQQPRLLVNE